jgi:hypothetical protein
MNSNPPNPPPLKVTAISIPNESRTTAIAQVAPEQPCGGTLSLTLAMPVVVELCINPDALLEILQTLGVSA